LYNNYDDCKLLNADWWTEQLAMMSDTSTANEMTAVY